MHPNIGHGRSSMGAAALGNFIFMMRENQIQATAVDIKDLTQILPAHCRALNMPTRTSPPPGTIPSRGIVIGRLPEHKIRRIPLIGSDFNPGTSNLFITVTAGQLPIIGHAGNTEQHMPFSCIGMTQSNEFFNHRQHLCDVVSGAWLNGWRQGTDGAHILLKYFRRFGGDFCNRRAAVTGTLVNLIVDIGDVSHISHLCRRIDGLQQAE